DLTGAHCAPTVRYAPPSPHVDLRCLGCARPHDEGVEARLDDPAAHTLDPLIDGSAEAAVERADTAGRGRLPDRAAHIEEPSHRRRVASRCARALVHQR